MLTCPWSPPSTLGVSSSQHSQASGSPPNPTEPRGSLTLAPLGEYCSPSPRFLAILPGFLDSRTLLMKDQHLDNLTDRPPPHQELLKFLSLSLAP